MKPNQFKVITFVIPGPVPGKPRMTQSDKWKQRDCVMRYRKWCDLVRPIVFGRTPPANTVQRLDWVAVFEPPKSWSKKRIREAMGQLHRSKPDRDNIDKAILDVLFNEDAAIADGHIQKRWGHEAKLFITITHEPKGEPSCQK